MTFWDIGFGDNESRRIEVNIRHGGDGVWCSLLSYVWCVGGDLRDHWLGTGTTPNLPSIHIFKHLGFVLTAFISGVIKTLLNSNIV